MAENLIQLNLTDKESQLINTVDNYRIEAEEARRVRDDKNQFNFDMYHLRQDYSHKKAGQSKEFLPKMTMAVEQITAFMHQGLVELGQDWFSIEKKLGTMDPPVTDSEAKFILGKQLEKTKFFDFIQDSIKSGLLGSLMVAKVGGKYVQKPTFFTKPTQDGLELKRRNSEVWQLDIGLVRQRDYFPDPTGQGLYELQRIEMDLHELKKIAKRNPEIYDLEAITQLGHAMAKEEEEKHRKALETDQAPTMSNYRFKIEIIEAWGTFLGPDGEVMYENHVCAVANNRILIRKPSPNPFWHGKSPFVVAPLMRVPHSVWHRALMDAPASLNQVINEHYNLILDAGFSEVWGVRQLRESWIDNADEFSDGIPSGAVLKANTLCPPGQKALERVDSGTMSNQALSVLQQTNGEFQIAALTPDLRQGILPERATKATEVVAAEQAITSTFNGMAKTVEEDYIKQVLCLSFLTIMQHVEDLNKMELEANFGKERAEKLLSLSKKTRFAGTADGFDFQVFGITQTLNKGRDFKKLTSLLQTISGSDVLSDQFSQKYDFGKLLDEIMKSLDVNMDKIRQGGASAILSELARLEQQMSGGGEASGLPEGPDVQSQISPVANQGPERNIPSEALSPGSGDGGGVAG